MAICRKKKFTSPKKVGGPRPARPNRLRRQCVCPSYRLLQQRAAGLLLWARRAGDIDDSCTAAAASPQQHGGQQ